MYGHDETNIIYADALQPHTALQPNSYDVLIANPPYAVTGFSKHLVIVTAQRSLSLIIILTLRRTML